MRRSALPTFLIAMILEAVSPILTSPKSRVSGLTPMAGLSVLSPKPLILTVEDPPSDWMTKEEETFPVLVGVKLIWIVFVTPGCSLVPFQIHPAKLKPKVLSSSEMEDTVIGLEPELVIEIS